MSSSIRSLVACGALASACSQTQRIEPPSPPTPPPQPAAPAPAAAAPSIFRLPSDVRPIRQRVELELVPDRETFSGRVEIAVELDRPRDDLWISARGLDFTESTLLRAGEKLPLRVEKDDGRGAARLIPPRTIEAGSATLVLAFRAAFHSGLVGLYRVKSQGAWYAFTQFEAVDARRAFPCFDEPSFKIPWEVVLTVPAGTTAVSNYPAAEETPAGPMKRIRFARTRPLPSYLVAFAVGDFDIVAPPPLPPNEIRSRPLAIRGIAPKGRGAELDYALRAGAELTVMLERWFGSEFPYPKLDHIALPDFEYGAMENAGLITYREQLLLVDPKSGSEQQKLDVTFVLAHEIGHQWYGDLVTMAWWDDFWLNESFASLVETKMTAAFAPEHRYDLVKLQDVQAAMVTDELSTVRPIRPDIATEGDIFGFDSQIAYHKGSWVIAMFEQFLGQDAFRAGIKQYMAAHADGNATRDDLIAALSAHGADIRPAMRSFVDQPGLPLVEAELRCDERGPRVALVQSRQLPLGSSASKEVLWAVPVCARADRGTPDCMLLQTKEGELPLSQKRCPAWIALNPEARGYYRWMLPPAQLRRLLTAGHRHLSPAERLSLASNLSAAFRSGALSAADVLAAVAPLAADPEPAVAQEPGELLRTIRDQIVEPASRDAVEAYMRRLYRPALARLGWKRKAGEPARVQIFRRWVVEYLALVAHDRRVLERAAAFGRAYVGTDGRLHPEAVDVDLVPVALKSAAQLGSPELFATMLERLRDEEDSTARQSLLAGIAVFGDPALAERARELSLGDELRLNERAYVIAEQGRTLELRPAAWAWTLKNFDALAARLPDGDVKLLTTVQGGCSDDAVLELEREMKRRIAPFTGAPYMLAKVIEQTRLCSAQVAAQRRSATEFFAGKGRAQSAARAQP